MNKKKKKSIGKQMDELELKYAKISLIVTRQDLTERNKLDKIVRNIQIRNPAGVN